MTRRRDRSPQRVSWFRRILGGVERTARKARRVRSRGADGATKVSPCKSCRRRIGILVRRCPHCGTQNYFPRADGPTHAEPDPCNEIIAQLSELQKQILVASLDETVEDPAIHVLRMVGPDEGEIKAGSQRLFGNDAVEAVEALLSTGFVARCQESGFELTEEGRRVAAVL